MIGAFPHLGCLSELLRRNHLLLSYVSTPTLAVHSCSPALHSSAATSLHSYSLAVLSCSPPVHSSARPLFTATRPLFAAVRPLFTAAHPLFTATHLLFTAARPLFTAAHPLFTAAHLLFTAARPLFTAAHPLFTATVPSELTTCRSQLLFFQSSPPAVHLLSAATASSLQPHYTRAARQHVRRGDACELVQYSSAVQ